MMYVCLLCWLGSPMFYSLSLLLSHSLISLHLLIHHLFADGTQRFFCIHLSNFHSSVSHLWDDLYLLPGWLQSGRKFYHLYIKDLVLSVWVQSITVSQNRQRYHKEIKVTFLCTTVIICVYRLLLRLYRRSHWKRWSLLVSHKPYVMWYYFVNTWLYFNFCCFMLFLRIPLCLMLYVVISIC